MRYFMCDMKLILVNKLEGIGVWTFWGVGGVKKSGNVWETTTPCEFIPPLNIQSFF